MTFRPIFIFFLLFAALFANAQNNLSAKAKTIEKKIYTTKVVEGLPPSIDGILNDPIWETVGWGGDFTQRQPYEGKAPSEETNFKILYDAKNLYIAYRLHDKEPEKIEKRLSRRDGFEGDWIEINIDSYHDLRTAFSFTISAAGVKGDEFVSNDGSNWDTSWDPIWYAKVATDDKGWTAEVRIPLSQLRFGNKEEHIWGIQFTRRFFRQEERSVWQFLPRNSASWVSRFGELHGIKGIKPQKQMEIQPYVVGKAESFEKEQGNPFATGSDFGYGIGLDGKIGVTSDLTVDFTINPDFGQVEADPSALALDGFQIFFQERRPFFIEGRNIFNYQITSSEAGGPFGSDQLFYSRRIGGAPRGNPDIEDHEFLDVPDNTTILGAAKFSGKTKKGLSIGLLESITQKEYATIDNNGEQRKEVVEPFTNYTVARLQQDFNSGNTIIGGMFTSVNRNIDDPVINHLHTSATTGGIDFLHRWKNQMWYVAANGVMSTVRGSTEAITNTQERFEHNFQRVDASHLTVDTTATSLTGHGGTVKLGKAGGGKRFNFEGGVSWRSPELELNDIGFLRSTDEIIHFLWAGYRIDQPFSVFRNIRFNYNHWSAWNFSGRHTFVGWNMNTHATFKNNYEMGTGFNWEPYDIGTKTLRGGPALRTGKSMNNWMYFNTDHRKKIQLNWHMYHSWGLDNDSRYKAYDLFVSYRPMRTLQMSLGPSLSINHNVLQYVDNIELSNKTQYLNATIDQKTLSMTLRLNYTINPNLSIQYYGSPFISRGQYSEFKYITDPMAGRFDNRFYQYYEDQIRYDEIDDQYIFDENKDNLSEFEIDNPDFNFMQFRSNLVVRWEYIPGSEIYLVWSQSNTNSGNPKESLIPSLVNDLFEQKAHNIFLMKYTYRFIR